MSTLAPILLLTAACGALSALVAGVFMLLPAARRNAVLPHLVSFATGALLGAALLALLPHALDSGAGAHGIGLALAAGIIAFFVLEKLVLWRHCHVDHCEAHGPEDRHRDRASATLILWGDAFHNLLDGVLIAAAFLTDPHLGVVTTVAVFAHEIPQEVGDLAILLNGGMSRQRALDAQHRGEPHVGRRRGDRVVPAGAGARVASLCARDRGGELPLRRSRGPHPRASPSRRRAHVGPAGRC